MTYHRSVGRCRPCEGSMSAALVIFLVVLALLLVLLAFFRTSKGRELLIKYRIKERATAYIIKKPAAEVRENRVASMAQGKSLDRGDEEVLTRPEKWRVCHIGGMSLHKGYQLLRRAVHELPQGLPLTFTVIDHRLASSVETYPSNWNGYPVTFQAPVPMDLMAKFYAQALLPIFL